MSADLITFPRAGVTVVTLRGGVRLAIGRSGGLRVEPSDCRPTPPPEPAPAAPVTHRSGALSMPSLGTQFGPRVAGRATTLSLADLMPPPTAQTATETAPPAGKSKYLTLQEAADRARRARGTISNAISAGSLKKKAGSYKVLIEPAELDRWLDTKRPTRRQAEAAKRKQAEAAKRKPSKKK